MNLIELSAQEKISVDGGVPWWLYVVSPGGAYLVDRFLDGVSETCPPCEEAINEADAMLT